MNSVLAIVAAVLLLISVAAYEIKKAIDVRTHWESGEHDWEQK
jgi:hypothetical protein